MHRFAVALDRDRPLFDEFLSICGSVAADFAREHALNLSPEPILVGEDDPGPIPQEACGIVGFDIAPPLAEQARRDGLLVADLMPYEWMAEAGDIDNDGDWLEQLPGYVWLIERSSSWREQLPLALRSVLGRALLRGYRSVFISYGGPDEGSAKHLAEVLESHGVTVWWFTRDAVPGQKLHRLMFDGVASHDRIVLLCSESSLSRNGVLNEIERVLEREAREGGSGILIPISLDDYVFSRWRPARTDLADQVRSRVIADYDDVLHGDGLRQLLHALRKIAPSRG